MMGVVMGSDGEGLVSEADCSEMLLGSSGNVGSARVEVK